jgi:hypothetical protein
VIGSDGSIAFEAPMGVASTLRVHALMPWHSATRKRLYYLDGTLVRFIGPGKVTGTVTNIALGEFEQAAFSVSPDDQRIAVSVLSYAPVIPSISYSYKGMRLYVEDLSGGGHHVDIFTSATVAEFPIGWTGGRLVMAVSIPVCCNTPETNQQINPYAATSYHVVDPATGNRLSSLCESSSGPEGPVGSSGVICLTAGGPPKFQRWDGSLFGPPAAVPNPSQYLNALSPDGTRVAVGGIPIRTLGPSGANTSLRESGYVFGWLDVDRIVFGRAGSNGFAGSNSFSVLDLKSGASIDLPVGRDRGIYLGTFPPAIS